jgi:hypothetical protein
MAMRHLLVSAAAVMAITGAAAVGNAQMQDKGPGQDRNPGAERGAPPSGGAEQSPGEKKQQAPSNREQKSEPRKGAEREPGRDKQPRAAQQNEPQKDKSATQPQRDQDKQKSTEQQRKGDQDKKAADQRKGDQDKQKSTEQQRKGDQDKKAADQRKGDQDKQKSTEQQRKGDDQDKKAADQRTGDQDKQKSAKDSDKSQTGRIQVTEEKRSGVRERLVKDRSVERVSRSRINVSINVGTTLPRSVRLHRFPTTVVSFAPAYRGYSYVLLEDETIVIVDERTYVIVDVIPAGSQRADRPGRTHLTLSQEDMRFIYRTVPKSRTADVRVRLALGAEVPRDVELLAFPDDIVERVPDVRRYRYIVTDNDIVVVDPDDHQVALVINE